MSQAQADYAQQQQALAAQAQLSQMLANAVQATAVYNPDTHLTTRDFDTHTDRTWIVTLRGSLKDLQRGTASASWAPQEGKEFIFQRIAGIQDGKPVYEGDLTKGIITDSTT